MENNMPQRGKNWSPTTKSGRKTTKTKKQAQSKPPAPWENLQRTHTHKETKKSEEEKQSRSKNLF
jgi:hypothetical protein